MGADLSNMVAGIDSRSLNNDESLGSLAANATGLELAGGGGSEGAGVVGHEVVARVAQNAGAVLAVVLAVGNGSDALALNESIAGIAGSDQSVKGVAGDCGADEAGVRKGKNVAVAGVTAGGCGARAGLAESGRGSR